MKNKLFFSLLMTMLLFIFPTSATEVVDSGTVGESLTWSLTQDETLIISGKGEMSGSIPWKYRSTIKAVIIEEGLTEIAPRAFSGCTALKNIALPASLSSVGNSAFSNCASLKEIVVADGGKYYFSVDGVLFERPRYVEQGAASQYIVRYPSAKEDTSFCVPTDTAILSNAFDGCVNLTNIKFQTSHIRFIYDNTFKDCSALESVEIPTGVKFIQSKAFYNCSNLAEVKIPSSVSQISSTAFSNCSALNAIYYDGNLVDWRSIYENTDLDGILMCEQGSEISGNLTDTILWTLDTYGLLSISGVGAMPDYTQFNYKECPWQKYESAIKRVDVSDGIVHIGSYTFWTYRELECVTIADSVNSIGDTAFAVSNIAEVIGASKLETIGDDAFRASSLSSFPFSDTLVFIGREAFKDCSLEKVIIPKTTTYIGAGAFANNTKLSAVEIHPDNTVYCVEDGVLFNSDKTELLCYPTNKTGDKYDVPESVVTITDYAFMKCKQLKEIALPDGLLYIGSEEGECAFDGCSGLTNIVFPDSLLLIGGSAFSDCKNIDDIILPSGVKVGNHAFMGCTSLKNIVIPEDITEFGRCAFSSCTSLEEIYLPPNITRIEVGLFDSCKQLKNIIIPPKVDSIGKDAFLGCTSLTSIIIPENVKTIEANAFIMCDKLENIVLKEGVERIEHGAFARSGLKSIVIPNSVQEIGQDAFISCKNIEKIIVLNPACAINEYQSIIETVEIHGAENSTAQKMANENEYQFSVHNFLPMENDFTHKRCTECGYEQNAYSITLGDVVEFRFEQKIPQNTSAFLACYNDKGKMVSIYKGAIVDECAVLFQVDSSPNADGAKIFLLDDFLNPICSPIVILD